MEWQTKAVFPRSPHRREIAAAAVQVGEELRQWWPLTVRQVFYQLVSVGVVDNTLDEYKTVVKTLTKARRCDPPLIPWEMIEDRTRTIHYPNGYDDVTRYFHDELSGFLDPQYYTRLVAEGQDVFVVVTVEKDALLPIVRKAARPYGVPVISLRGRPSATLVKELADLLPSFYRDAKILHFGDFDPTGWAIHSRLELDLEEHHGIFVEVQHAALLPSQIEEYNLPQSIDAAKPGDRNIKAWHAEFGSNAKPVELDALHPRDLEVLVKDSIEAVFDLDVWREQLAKQFEERERLEREYENLRRVVRDAVKYECPWLYFGDDMLDI